jgi:hypothetical protein
MFLTLFQHNRRKNMSVAEAMPGELWMSDLMHDVTIGILAKYIMLWIVVDEVEFDFTDQRPDEIVWARTANGEYSVSLAYQMQFQGSINSDFQSLIWQVRAPSRCRFYIWLML